MLNTWLHVRVINFRIIIIIRGPNCVAEANFVEIAETAAKIWRFYYFPRWRPSAILDLLCVCADHPRRAFDGLYRCAKSGWNKCSRFDNMRVFQFHEFGLKTPIHAPKIGVLGVFDPLNGAQYQRNPKRHILGEKDVIWRIDCENRSTGATCVRDEGTKEQDTKKPEVRAKSGYLPRPPTSSDRNEILRGGWSEGDSSKVRISSTSVKRFRTSGVEIYPLPLTWPLAYTTACTTVQAVTTRFVLLILKWGNRS